MVNNSESNGAMTKAQSVKPSAASNELFDQNNNDKGFKDRNVPTEYKFSFDASSKFNYYNTESSTASVLFSDQENEQENLNPNPNFDHNLSLYQNKVTQPVLKPLNLNVNDIYLNQKTNSSISANHYYSHGNSGAIKRGCEDVENENEDDLVTSISSSTGCSRRSPPKKPKFVVTSEEMNEYFSLLHQVEIQNFLKRDACCLISDKYALAMVFTYFKRAKFNLQEYTKDHFYLALYLASDIEEDVDEYKYEIFPWALGNNWRSKFSGFLRRRDALLRRIGYRAIVSRKCCEEVMSFKSEHYAWKRERAEDHGGATRGYLINRSKRFLLSKSNLEEDELNLPRLPEESPRPCPICLINRGWNSLSNSINLPEQKPKSVLNAQKISNSEIKTGFIKSYNLNKKQKSNDFSKEVSSKPKPEKTVKTPPQKKTSTRDLESTSETESDLSANTADLLKKDSKIPAANKFLKIKLSTTELENNHRGSSQVTSDLNSQIENSNFSFVNLQRHSSLVSVDKFLIKDYVDTSDEDSDSSSGDDVFSTENKISGHKILVKKQELSRLNAAKSRASKVAQQNAPIKKRNNYSLSNASNYNLRSHSATDKAAQKNSRAKLQLVPID